ncbi:MAG: pyridoxal-phosphate dependent enzyme, partial [Gemmatimonadota bacterium]|nr:pyridoxal-phosphate dependent enzyme [Gemmatimonadota bacterium]
MDPLASIPLEAIEAARDRIAGAAIRTPLLPLECPEAACEVWIKLECLQPIGSFKIRGATNAMALADPGELA